MRVILRALLGSLAIAWLVCRLVQAGQIETIAGTGREADGGDAGPVLRTNVGNPYGLEIGPDRALYVCEVSNHRVRRLNLGKGELTTVAGTGRKGYAGDGGPATKALLNEPYEVRFDKSGNMYFVEMQNHLVRRVDAKTGIISTLAGTGSAGFAGDGGPAAKGQFRQPHSIALDGRGGLYVADIGNHRIRRIDLETGLIDTVAGNGAKELPADGQTARGRPMLGPRALAIDGRTMWIALREGNSVWRMDLDRGTLHHVAGTGRKGYADGDAKVAAFDGPKGIAVGSDGRVYVADTENQAIRAIDLKRGQVATVAGAGPKDRGYNGDGREASTARLNRPHGICLGGGGEIFIGDSENHRVRVVQAK